MKKLIFIFAIIATIAGSVFGQNVAVGTGFLQRGGAIPGLTFDGEGIVIGAPADSLIIEIPTSFEATISVILSATSIFVVDGQAQAQDIARFINDADGSPADSSLVINRFGQIISTGVGATTNNTFADSVDVTGEVTATDITATNDVIADSLRANTGIRTPTVLFDLTQDYLLTERSTTFAFQGQTAGAVAGFEVFTADGDGTDNILFALYSLGTPAGITNSERLLFNFVAGSQVNIQSIASGGGTARPMVISTAANTDQLRLATDAGVYTGTNGNEENYINVEIFNDSTVTGETTWSSVLPAGFIIESIIFKNTTANEITDLDIGFTDGGGEIVGTDNLLASDEGSFSINQEVDDFDAADNIFISAGNWNSASVIIYIRMVRIF